MQRSVVYFDLHLSAAHPNAGQNMHFSIFWLDKSKKETPKHSSSDARASDSRLKGPEFNPHQDPMRLCFKIYWVFVSLSPINKMITQICSV